MLSARYQTPISTLTLRRQKELYAEALQEKLLRLEAKRLEDSLIDFFEAAWPNIDPSAFKRSWHHEAIAEHLEQVAFGNIPKLLINCPPRHTKTLLVSVAFPAWVWAQEPDPQFPIIGPQASFMCLSYADSLAMDHALLMKRLVTSPWYQARWGRRVKIAPDKESAAKFDTTAQGSRISGSMGGSNTGRGASYRIFDDPHNVKQVDSDTIRKATIDGYDQALKNRVTDPKTSVEITVMQRTHEGDLSGHVLETDPNYVHLCLPAEFEPDRHCLTYVGGEPFWADPRQAKGEVLWSDQWGDAQLKPFKDNEYTWAGQYQQRPAPRGGGIIKREHWRLWGDEEDPELLKPENAKFRTHPNYTLRIGVLDTAYTDKQRNDPSAMAVWGLFADGLGIPNVMLASSWRDRLLFPDLLAKVLATARKMRIDYLLIEDKTAGPPLIQELRRRYADEPWIVEAIPINRTSGDKSVRLTSVSPSFTQGQVWAPNKQWANDFIDVVSMFPHGVHDEEVDLTSMGLGWLRKNGMLDTEAEIKSYEEDKRKRRGGRQQPLYPGTKR